MAEFKLYPYQRAIIEAILKAKREGKPFVMQLPRRTGVTSILRAVAAEEAKLEGKAPVAIVYDEIEPPDYRR